MNDSQLLAEYVQTRSDAAFAQLMLRHVDLVYSSALRQTRDPDAAEEITQAVFVVLSQKAHALGPRDALSPWLYNATRIAALDTRRKAARRRRHEQRASSMAIETLAAQHQSGAQWKEIAWMLDDALAALTQNERAALVLRYFDNRSVRDVSGALGVSEDAAEKRVARALQKLRLYFARRGREFSLPALALLLGSSAVQAAPAEVAAALPAKVAAAQSSLACLNSTLAKGVLKIMATNQMLKTAGLAAACLLLGCVGTLTVEHAVLGSVTPPEAEPETVQQRPAAPADQRRNEPAYSEAVPQKIPAPAHATAANDGRVTLPAIATIVDAAPSLPGYPAPAKVAAVPPGENAAAANKPVAARAEPPATAGGKARVRSLGTRSMGGGTSMSGRGFAGVVAGPAVPGAPAAPGKTDATVNTIQIDGTTGRMVMERSKVGGDEVYVLETVNDAPAAGAATAPRILYRAPNGELPPAGSGPKVRIIAPGQPGRVPLTENEFKNAVPVKPPTTDPASKAPAKEPAREEF